MSVKVLLVFPRAGFRRFAVITTPVNNPDNAVTWVKRHHPKLEVLWDECKALPKATHRPCRC